MIAISAYPNKIGALDNHCRNSGNSVCGINNPGIIAESIRRNYRRGGFFNFGLAGGGRACGIGNAYYMGPGRKPGGG